MKQTWAAPERNKGPILEVLQRHAPPRARVLEIASGTGQHAAWLAPRLDVSRWQPTDPDPDARASIAAWAREVPLLAEPVALSTVDPWPVAGPFDLVMCVNMVHISPWEATLALLDGAARVLDVGGVLYLYGPYRRAGVPTAPSNEAFDESLRARNPAWGLRQLEAVLDEASARGMAQVEVVEMPANNLSVVLRRAR